MQGAEGAGTGKKKNAMAFKRDMLKNLLVSLRARAGTEACPFGGMSLHERKRAVKSAADVAMAAARGAAVGGRARWARAILAAATVPSSSSSSSSPVASSRKVKSCRRVVRRRCSRKRLPAAGAAASSAGIARTLLRRRTMALRKVIPGADAAMDEASLLREAMDYVVHLRAQVDVLRRVSAAMQIRSSYLRDPWSQSAPKEKEASSGVGQ